MALAFVEVQMLFLDDLEANALQDVKEPEDTDEKQKQEQAICALPANDKNDAKPTTPVDDGPATATSKPAMTARIARIHGFQREHCAFSCKGIQPQGTRGERWTPERSSSRRRGR